MMTRSQNTMTLRARRKRRASAISDAWRQEREQDRTPGKGHAQDWAGFRLGGRQGSPIGLHQAHILEGATIILRKGARFLRFNRSHTTASITGP